MTVFLFIGKTGVAIEERVCSPKSCGGERIRRSSAGKRPRTFTSKDPSVIPVRWNKRMILRQSDLTSLPFEKPEVENYFQQGTTNPHWHRVDTNKIVYIQLLSGILATAYCLNNMLVDVAEKIK
jgi:hypothetical protein